MVNIVIKPTPQHDFYLIYNTTSDMPTRWGTRLALLEQVPWATEDVMARADLFGTSDLYNLDQRGWGARALWIGNGLDSADEEPFVAREDLRQLCESWDSNSRTFTPTEGAITLVPKHDP